MSHPTKGELRTRISRLVVAPTTSAGVVVIITLVLVAIAIRADLPSFSSWRIAVDVATGMAFVVAGVTAPGGPQMRGLFVTVGWAWLLASLPTVPGSLHQSLLAVSLVAFPTGRPMRCTHWLVIALAVPVAFGLVPQVGVAALFLAVAVIRFVQVEPRSPWVWFPVASAVLMSVVLGVIWIFATVDRGNFDPRTALLVYQLALIPIAAGYAVASRMAAHASSRLTDSILGEAEAIGLDGLRSVLAATLRDPGLAIHPWTGEGSGYSVGAGSDVDSFGRLEVTENGSPIALVFHSSPLLEDPVVEQSVADAIRMTLTNEMLLADLEKQLDALKTARSRLMSAVDEVREMTAIRLREGVVGPVAGAAQRLSRISESVADDEANAALSVAMTELGSASRDITTLVTGLPPAGSDQSGIRRAIADLAARSPIPATGHLTEDFGLDVEASKTLYYVALEAMTNAIKHSDASHIEISVEEGPGDLELRVSDNGRGGADSQGSGLLGLADRLAVHGGQLRVESPSGAGTTVTATIPISRSSPRA